MGLLINASVAMAAAAGLTVPRCASERGLTKGGGRPAERRFTVGGSGKSVARCHRTVLAYWKFESISLQGRVMQTIGSSAAEKLHWCLTVWLEMPLPAIQRASGALNLP